MNNDDEFDKISNIAPDNKYSAYINDVESNEKNKKVNRY